MNRCKAIIDFCHQVIESPHTIEFAINSLFSPNICVSSPLGGKIGYYDIKEHLEMWLQAFSDLQLAKIDVSEKNNTAVVSWSVKGVHQGIFSNILPTNKSLELNGIAIWEFNDQNQVDALTYRADMLGFFKQLGFYLEKDAYFKQNEIKGNYELLLKASKRFGTDQNILTKSEVMCLAFYVNGLTAKQIAKEIGRSCRTIQVHIANVMDKLGCSHKNQLYDRMQNNGLKYMFRDFYDVLKAKNINY